MAELPPVDKDDESAAPTAWQKQYGQLLASYAHTDTALVLQRHVCVAGQLDPAAGVVAASVVVRAAVVAARVVVAATVVGAAVVVAGAAVEVALPSTTHWQLTQPVLSVK